MLGHPGFEEGAAHAEDPPAEVGVRRVDLRRRRPGQVPAARPRLAVVGHAGQGEEGGGDVDRARQVAAHAGAIPGARITRGTWICSSVIRMPWAIAPFSPKLSPWSEATTTIVR